VMPGDTRFYGITKAIHNALHGAAATLDASDWEYFQDISHAAARELQLDGDLIMIHDPQPVALAALRRKPGQTWVWRCHIDLSAASRDVWSMIATHVADYDSAIFSHHAFVPAMSVPAYLVPPSIDPLSDKNRELTPREITTIVGTLGVPLGKPLLVQIGPFTRDRDPLGVVNAYRLVKKSHPVRLVLAGSAGDDRESLDVLSDLREAAQRDEDIVVLELPPDAHLQINALQRAATIVLQKSLRKKFGLGAAKAMWKSKPVIGGFAGGLPQQIVYDVTGYTVRSVEGAAFRIRHLLNNPELIARMGAAGREHARRSFLTTRHLTEYLALLIHVTDGRER